MLSTPKKISRNVLLAALTGAFALVGCHQMGDPSAQLEPTNLSTTTQALGGPYSRMLGGTAPKQRSTNSVGVLARSLTSDSCVQNNFTFTCMQGASGINKAYDMTRAYYNWGSSGSGLDTAMLNTMLTGKANRRIILSFIPKAPGEAGPAPSAPSGCSRAWSSWANNTTCNSWMAAQALKLKTWMTTNSTATVMIAYNHEPVNYNENPVETPAQYGAAYRKFKSHMHGTFGAVAARNRLSYGIILQSFNLTRAGGGKPYASAEFYNAAVSVNAADIQWVGVDGYGATPANTFASVFNPVCSWARNTSKNLWIPETGGKMHPTTDFNGDGDTTDADEPQNYNDAQRATWVNGMRTFMLNDPCSGMNAKFKGAAWWDQSVDRVDYKWGSATTGWNAYKSLTAAF